MRSTKDIDIELHKPLGFVVNDFCSVLDDISNLVRTAKGGTREEVFDSFECKINALNIAVETTLLLVKL